MRLAHIGPRGIIQQWRDYSAKYASLVEAVRASGIELLGLKGACFGAAGPVEKGRCVVTNLPWVLDERKLRRGLGLPHVRLLNDLAAMAWGATQTKKRVSLQRGKSKGNIAVLAAGTGLGEAAWIEADNGGLVLSTEGGHADFAPRTREEFEILEFAAARLSGRVSCERVLSGPGLTLLYDFYRDRRRYGESRQAAHEREAAADPNRVILALSRKRGHRAARAAVDAFVSLYGAEAGNLALRVRASGGICIGGSLANALANELRSKHFFSALHDKGRFAPWLKSLRIDLITDPDIALHGAFVFATQGCVRSTLGLQVTQKEK